LARSAYLIFLRWCGKSKKSPAKTIEAKNSHGLGEITSIRDFGEVEKDPHSEIDNTDHNVWPVFWNI